MADDVRGRPRLFEYPLAFMAYASAACVLLYPVFTSGADRVYSPASALSRPIASFAMWILAWGTHALTSPARLFDANVFHPVPNALAFGDSLLGVVPLFAPTYLLGGNVVLAYQVTLLATLSLCGASMYYLVRHWGAGVAAAALAGVVYAFCPARLGVLAELPHLSMQFLPLALLFADRTLASGRGRDALLLFLFAAWQSLCGTQIAYASLLILAAYVAVAALAKNGRWRGAALAAVALALAAAVFALSMAPYRALVAEQLFASGRTMREFATFDAADAWRAYLVPPYFASRGWGSGGQFYVGIAVLLFAGAGVAGMRRRRGTLAPLLAVLLLSYWMSLGPGALLYGAVLERVPGFSVYGPAPSRFAVLAMLPIAALAGLGVDRLRWRGGGRVLIAAAASAVVLVDYRLPFQHFATRRIVVDRAQMPLHETLAELPTGPVLTLPIDPCSVDDASAIIGRQLASVLHWQPLIDGYRSHERAPSIYPVVRALAAALPDARALELLQRSTGLRYLVVHLTDVPGDWRHRWREVEGMTRLGFFGHDLLFRLNDEAEADLGDELLGLPRSERTLTGVALAPLAADQRAAGLRFAELPPGVATAGNRVRAAILVENRSPVVWPALSVDGGRVVHLSYLWTDGAGKLVGGNPKAQPLPLDLAAGQSVVVSACVEVPSVSGELNLAFGLTQGDQWFTDSSEPVRVEVVAE